MTVYAFLDCETTSLDPAKGQVWELAYALDHGPIKSSIIPHSLLSADAEALEIGQYERRAASAWSSRNTTLRCGCAAEPPYLHECIRFEDEALTDLKGATLVGANPAFDQAFLKARWGQVPWHYRMIDVQTYAMPLLRLDRPPSLLQARHGVMALLGVDIPEPDHTAAGDVATTRALFYALKNHYDGWSE